MAWINASEPNKGYRYLYLEDEDYKELKKENKKEIFKSEPIKNSNGKLIHKLTDIIGAEDGLGVECLSGSGAAASAFSRAFREGFTITLVSGRTVGIGAYLARLGRR